MERLGAIADPRHQAYVKYKSHVLLATRILSAIFYISSMRKTSEEFNCEIVIENIGRFCGEDLEELPYWETINNYLERVNPEELQNTVCALLKRLIRSRAFEDARIRGRYWHILIDGSGIVSSREELDGNYIFKVHHRGKPEEPGSETRFGKPYRCERHDGICGEHRRGSEETGLRTQSLQKADEAAQRDVSQTPDLYRSGQFIRL